jgi:hypothetical protein
VLLPSEAVAQVRLAKRMPVSPRLICLEGSAKALRTPSRASAISAVDLCDSPVEKKHIEKGAAARTSAAIARAELPVWGVGPAAGLAATALVSTLLPVVRSDDVSPADRVLRELAAASPGKYPQAG